MGDGAAARESVLRSAAKESVLRSAARESVLRSAARESVLRSAATESVLRSADEAFARVMRGAPQQVATMPPDLEPADFLRWAGDRVTELLAGIADLPLDRLLSQPAPPSRPGPPPGPQPRGEPITVRAGRGSIAETRVWVHSIGRLPAATLRFALSDLVGPDGATWTGAEAVFAPAELVLPGPASASVLLRLTVPDDAAPGEHHGLILGCGVAGAVLPITVVVG